jgi:hypothetical protein
MGWAIQWSPPLLPDLAWIPGDEVFLEGGVGSLLAAGSDEAPASLFVSPDTPPGSQKKISKRSRQKETQQRKAKGNARTEQEFGRRRGSRFDVVDDSGMR